MPDHPVALVEYAPEWRDPLVRLWRRSFEFGVGVVDPHPIAEQAAYFEAEVLPQHTVRLALAGRRLVGFVAASKESVAQLHVRVGFHRCGIGSTLLDWAKHQSGGSLWLYTFKRNAVAQAFYEHHGFRIVSRGFEPAWQLEDIRYQWTAAQDGAMPLTLVLSDSEVASIVSIGSGLQVRLAAAHLRRTADATPGRVEHGFGRGVVFRLDAVQVVEEEQPALGRLATGRIQVADQWLSEIALPFVATDPVRIELGFANGASLVVAASGVSAQFEGEPNFTDSLAC